MSPIGSLIADPISAVFFLVAVVIAVTVHEWAHAKTADYLGDPTPSALGRVTLDPRAHLDPLGSILFLIAGFGWGKPVPFDPYNLKNPRRDAALISLAGPASNYILAIVSSLVLKLVVLGAGSAVGGLAGIFVALFTQLIIMNVVLGTFNLLPFAPLDGFKIVGGFLSHSQAKQWYSLERYGIMFLIFFILPFAGGRSMISMFIYPVISFVIGLLL